MFRWVQTETGDKGADQRGMKRATVTLEESVSGILDKVCRDCSGRDIESFAD